MRTEILTEGHLMRGASEGGAWSRTQLALLGVSWPPKGGWRKRIVGQPIDSDDLSRFLQIKDAHKHRKDGDKRKEREEYRSISQRKQLF